PGNYTATVTDNAGNTTNLPATLFPYTSLLVESSATDVSCYGLCDGSISLNFISGTPPYQILWSDGSTGGQGLNNICSGIYSAEITDANGCSILIEDTIHEPAPFANTPNIQMVDCKGALTGSIFHNITGGTEPYSYAWDYDPFNLESNAVYLSAGDYSTTITDSNGCVFEQTFTITEPDTLSYTVDTFLEGGLGVGTVEITTAGGTPPYQWNWLHGDSNEDSFIPELTTSYCIITDFLGCTIQTESFTTLTHIGEQDFEFNVYPNPTASQIQIETNEVGKKLSVFDSQGKLVCNWQLMNQRNTFQIDHFTEGLYFIEYPKNGKTLSIPFVVRK
ncbi:MAG: T9SS type A sorting domain-containing protein, partial [Bacteroidota bacterium]